tara:strand:+ start:614 stop:1051 length:438 start_codon:yes stop_codon:yes gene_type:complete
MNLKSIKKYDEKSSVFIFNLRNKFYVRKNSLDKKIIKFEDHTRWLKKFFKKKNYIYLVVNNKKLIGYIRLELKRNIHNVSWALEKENHGKGIIKKFLQKATNNKNVKYKAIIKKNNLASISVAYHAKFELKLIRNQICYLYKNIY